MKSFSFEVPTKIVFGEGLKNLLPEIAEPLGEKIFILSGSTWFGDSGLRQKIVKLLSGYTIQFHYCPKGEPTISSVDSIAGIARKFQPDLIVGIGGGSVLDTAKAVSGLIREHGSIEEYLEGASPIKELSKPVVPWIAIPTTAGTGAEATKNAVIRSNRQQAKRSFRSPYLYAHQVIIDPELTFGLLPEITGYSGLDALTQLLESYVSVKSNVLTSSLVRGAFPVMLDALKRLSLNRDDTEARSQACYGSLVSGIALANSGLGAVHGFASGLGGMFEIPHGLICACLLNPVLEANSDEIFDKISLLAGDIGVDRKMNPITWLTGEISAITERFGIKPHLRAYNIDRGLVKTIVAKSKGSSMSGNPKHFSDEELESIVLKVL